MGGFRTERDTMGEMQVPAAALYGASTQRAVENFPISTLRLQRPFLRAIGLIKAAAAKVNGELGQLRAVRVFNVAQSSPADAAGLREGDLLLEANQTPLFSVDDLQRVMVLSGRGTISLGLLRDGQRLRREVTPQQKRKAA